jgi:hypothetical protein
MAERDKDRQQLIQRNTELEGQVTYNLLLQFIFQEPYP